MAILATTNQTKKSIEIIPAGSYPARCYSMIHIGTIEETFNGETKERNKVRITWELPTELITFNEERGEQPRVIAKEFTLSLHEKSTLRSFLESWRGKSFTDKDAQSFDVTNLLGVPCLLSITHKTSGNGKTYANIASVSMLPKGMDCPDQINENQEFTYSDFKQELFDSFPDFIKEKIVMSKEYQSLNQDTNEGLPF